MMPTCKPSVGEFLVIKINDKKYELKQLTEGDLAYWQFIVHQELQKLYNPIEEFAKTLSPKINSGFAIYGFIASRQNLDYPQYFRLLAENSLISAKTLVKILTDCDEQEVNDNNYANILAQIHLHWTDEELAKIKEMQ